MRLHGTMLNLLSTGTILPLRFSAAMLVTVIFEYEVILVPSLMNTDQL
jgi:hypothetical protein